MSDFKMDVYTASSGVEMTLTWESEEEFRLGKAFLEQLLDGDSSFLIIEEGKIPFCYLRDREQLLALHDFRRELRNRRSQP
jgi:hypothetical protein